MNIWVFIPSKASIASSHVCVNEGPKGKVGYEQV
jgi:hypothetical protein